MHFDDNVAVAMGAIRNKKFQNSRCLEIWKWHPKTSSDIARSKSVSTKAIAFSWQHGPQMWKSTGPRTCHPISSLFIHLPHPSHTQLPLITTSHAPTTSDKTNYLTTTTKYLTSAIFQHSSDQYCNTLPSTTAKNSSTTKNIQTIWTANASYYM